MTDPKKILQAFEREQRYNKLRAYRPYGHPDTFCPDETHEAGALWSVLHEEGLMHPWSNNPVQSDFMKAGAVDQERMLVAANRVGKTHTAGAEVAMHMTGLYPDWWEGKRFDKPVLVWTGSPTNETSRDIVQKELLGGTTNDLLGTGMIPKDQIYGKPKMKQAGISDVVDQFRVRHARGGQSLCSLKTFEQGWRKWQGAEPDIAWLDEEPDQSAEQRRIYTEALTRLLTSHGIMLVTFTPLLGVTDLVEHFQEGGAGISVFTATWDDAPHLRPDEKARLLGSFPPHEREARTRGVPMMGEGRVFTTPEDEIVVSPFEIPTWWAQIRAVDFGIDHPAATVRIAWDRDKDIIYLVQEWKERNNDTAQHVEATQAMGTWIPTAWPHDGTTREKSSGKRLKDQYVAKGLKMLSLSARYKNDTGGGQPVEPIVNEIFDRCLDGRFKVFSTCVKFREEYRNYHRKDGKLSKVRDDLLKATFYAVMMRRYAAVMRRRTRDHAAPRALRA